MRELTILHGDNAQFQQQRRRHGAGAAQGITSLGQTAGTSMNAGQQQRRQQLSRAARATRFVQQRQDGIETCRGVAVEQLAGGLHDRTFLQDRQTRIVHAQLARFAEPIRGSQRVVGTQCLHASEECQPR